MSILLKILIGLVILIVSILIFPLWLIGGVVTTFIMYLYEIGNAVFSELKEKSK